MVSTHDAVKIIKIIVPHISLFKYKFYLRKSIIVNYLKKEKKKKTFLILSTFKKKLLFIQLGL